METTWSETCPNSQTETTVLRGTKNRAALQPTTITVLDKTVTVSTREKFTPMQ